MLSHLLRLNSLKKQMSFTLVEVVISTIILTLTACALFATLRAGFILVNDIGENIIVSSAIQQEIENERKKVIPSVVNRTFDPNDSYTGETPLVNASGNVTVEQYNDIPTDVAKRMVVTVTWTSRLRPSKQNTKHVSTIIAKNGINYL